MRCSFALGFKLRLCEFAPYALFPLVAALRGLLQLEVDAAMKEEPDEDPGRTEVSAVAVVEEAFRPAGHQLSRDQLRLAGHQLGRDQLQPAVESWDIKCFAIG